MWNSQCALVWKFVVLDAPYLWPYCLANFSFWGNSHVGTHRACSQRILGYTRRLFAVNSISSIGAPSEITLKRYPHFYSGSCSICLLNQIVCPITHESEIFLLRRQCFNYSERIQQSKKTNDDHKIACRKQERGSSTKWCTHKWGNSLQARQTQQCHTSFTQLFVKVV